MSSLQELNFVSIPNEITVTLSPEVLDHFQKNAQFGKKTESGGQLFGKFTSPYEVLISNATGPNKKYHRLRHLLRLDLPTDQKEIDHFFSMGLHYVGDWHTHPAISPVPSRTDLKTFRSRFLNSEHELTAMVMIIVGTNCCEKELWVGLQKQTSLQRLVCKTTEESLR